MNAEKVLSATVREALLQSKSALDDVCLVGQYVMDPIQRQIQNRARAKLEALAEYLKSV
jgi:hypothetical protein